MNINRISGTNFKAHFKDDYEYWFLREYMMNLGITHEQVKDCDKFLHSQPDAEIVIDAFDEDEHKAYIYGAINTPKGKSKEFMLEDFKTPECIYTFRNMLADMVKKLTKSERD